METLELDITDERTLPDAAKRVLEFSGRNKMFTVDAPMGAGKTTFIKHLCRELGSKDNFSSPTYSIVNEYSSPQGKIYHFDLYRIKTLEELLDIGFDEYIHSGQYCFIEWPEVARKLLPKIGVDIKFYMGKSRKLVVEKPSSG